MKPLTKIERLNLAWKVGFWLKHDVVPQKFHYTAVDKRRNNRIHELQHVLHIIVCLSKDIPLDETSF